MASEKLHGKDHACYMDKLTASRSLTDGSAEMLSGSGSIDCNFSSADDAIRELSHPGIHPMLGAEDVLKGSATYNTIPTSTQFHDDRTRKCIQLSRRRSTRLIRSSLPTSTGLRRSTRRRLERASRSRKSRRASRLPA